MKRGQFNSPFAKGRVVSFFQDFETCAVCTKTRHWDGVTGLGDTFGCVTWGHSFIGRTAGCFWRGRVTYSARYIQDMMWVTNTKRDYHLPGAPPSAHMRFTISMALPSGRPQQPLTEI